MDWALGTEMLVFGLERFFGEGVFWLSTVTVRNAGIRTLSLLWTKWRFLFGWWWSRAQVSSIFL